MSESETEKTGDESETAENVEDMVTTTRSGRVITNWRVSNETPIIWRVSNDLWSFVTVSY
jgi:hypothetical protein